MSFYATFLFYMFYNVLQNSFQEPLNYQMQVCCLIYYHILLVRVYILYQIQTAQTAQQPLISFHIERYKCNYNYYYPSTIYINQYIQYKLQSKKGASCFAGQQASALQTSTAMTQSASLPFSHPCNFHVVSETMPADGLFKVDIQYISQIICNGNCYVVL